MLISAPFYSFSQSRVAGDTVKTVKTVTTDTLPDESLEKRIIYNAKDSARYEAKGNKIYLFGEAYVEYETMNLKSEFIEIDYDKNLITAYGKTDSSGKKVGTPLFKDAEQEFNAEKMMYNLKTKKGKIFNVLTKQGDLLVFGNEIKKDSTDIVYMKNLRCIPCQYDDARTVFKATKAKIIPEDKIVTGPMYLSISEVPTPLVLPFGFFPNTKKRHNGILLPFYGNSPTQGYYLRDGGFYWGISDKTDMIIHGDIYSNKSWGLRTTNDYNVLYKYSGSLNLGYSEFIFGDKDVPKSYSKQKSYAVTWNHAQDNRNNPSIRFTANVNYINQKYNKYNALNSGQYLSNTFQSNINFTKTWRLSSLSINATHSQNTINKQVDITFPQLTYNVNRFFPFKRRNVIKPNVFGKIGVSYLLEARNTLSSYDSIMFKGDIEKKLRYGVRHSVPISTNFNLFRYITVTPAINLSAVMYTKTTLERLATTAANTYTILPDTVRGFKTGYDANFTTSMNTKLFMDYMFRRGKVQQIRHLLIPTVTYQYRPDFGKEQYGFWKSVPTDTLGHIKRYSIFENTIFGGPDYVKRNAIVVNLSNNIEAKVKQNSDTGAVYKKVTVLQNLSLNGGYNFAIDSFQMDLINITARNKIWKFFDLVGNVVMDPYRYDTVAHRRMNVYQYNYNGQLARFALANIALNATFSSNALEAMRNTRRPPNLTNAAERGGVQMNEGNVRIPWNLMIYYNVIFDKQRASKVKITQTLNFSGDISVTKYWKIGATSGYDFTLNQISYTSINLYRDLKCWEARIDWIPFGFRRSYNLTINIKTSMLHDMKLTKQRPPMSTDNF